MSWTAPSAPATGFLVTAAFWQAQIPDNLSALMQAPSTITTTGTQTALAIPGGAAGDHGELVLFLNNATLLTIQGMTPGFDGQRLRLFSIGAGQVDFVHQSASATSTNRLVNCATSGNTSLAAGSGSASYVYDGTASRWRLETHEQGAWITPTFSAGAFVGNGGTWTVDSGDVFAHAYILRGKTLTHVLGVASTTLAAGSTGLRLTIPGGFQVAKNVRLPASGSDNGTFFNGTVDANVAFPTLIEYFRDAGALIFAASTNNTSVWGEISFEVV